MIIRREEPSDYRAVEELTKRAFWNVYVPGCDEHYLVHRMRGHADFIPALAHVMVDDGRIIGNIMYTRALLRNEKIGDLEIVSFGPVSIDPAYQRRGLGKRLIEYTLGKAKAMGFDYAVIYGNPANYVSAGFRSCKRFGVYVGERVYPTALLVNRIGSKDLGDIGWEYLESGAYSISRAEAEEFDKGFPYLDKKETARQEEFFILSNSAFRVSPA